MPRAEQLRVLEHGRDSGKNSGGKQRHAHGASCLPPLLLQVLRRLVQCGGWKISACRGAQALTEVCDSQQTRPVLHCAAASLHLLQDEARRAARHIGECATAKAPVAIGLMVFARRVWTSLETTRALFGSAFNRPFSCRPAPPAWPPGGRADARSEIAKCLSITLRGWSPSSQRCNPHGQAATSAGGDTFQSLGHYNELCLLVGVIASAGVRGGAQP